MCFIKPCKLGMLRIVLEFVKLLTVSLTDLRDTVGTSTCAINMTEHTPAQFEHINKY